MTVAERAWQVWALLAFAAGNRQTLTYELVGQLTGMATPGLGAVLEPIQSYCLLNELPALSALVVNKTTGLPGTGFIAAEDVPREFIRIFERDWRVVGCPSPEALADAVRRQPSNGIPVSPGEQTRPLRTNAPGVPRSGSVKAKYQPLREYLAARQNTPRVQVTFAEIEALIGTSLPDSAFKYREWWSNQSDTSNRSQAAAWLNAGFRVESVDQSRRGGFVVFVPHTAAGAEETDA
jgi:hypothetical protein